MDEPTKVTVLWTNADVLTSEKMVLMYVTNSMIKNWWKEVTVIIWGATAKLAAENELIQEKIKMAQNVGVKFIACKGCADSLGVSDKLASMAIEVIYTGHILTEILKADEKLITI